MFWDGLKQVIMWTLAEAIIFVQAELRLLFGPR